VSSWHVLLLMLPCCCNQLLGVPLSTSLLCYPAVFTGPDVIVLLLRCCIRSGLVGGGWVGHCLSAAASAGPDVGGPNGPYRQSERAEIYKSYVDKLVAAGEGQVGSSSSSSSSSSSKQLLAVGQTGWHQCVV
jgi:hypothetical protein